MALIDFTLSNARRFYSSMGNPLGWKGLKKIVISLKGYDHLNVKLKTYNCGNRSNRQGVELFTNVWDCW